jgi:peptidoglycan/LPS O-acetylase OafA/YrhL
VYIWHVPAEKILGTARLRAMGLPPLAGEIVRAVFAVMLGLASYYLIERTFLRLKNPFARPASAGPAAVVSPTASKAAS